MKLKKHIFRWLGGAVLGLAMVSVATSCTDDLGQNFGQEDLGEKVHGVLSVQLGPSTPVQASRAVDFSPNAMVKIDSYWIGIFDTKTGELIGTTYDEHPRKDDGTRWTLRNDNDTPFTVDGIDIYYYEHNPYAYIVGVVNFNDVMAKMPGDEEATTPVIDYLKDVKKLTDIKDIVIDTQSADRANRARGSDEANPLMMGFYSTAKTSIHTQMNPDGSLYNSPIGSLLGNYETSQEAVAHISGSNGVDINLSEGSIRLQRLLAEVNVMIRSEYESGYNYGHYNYIKRVRYKVMNKPQDVYLVEHAVDLSAWDRSSKDDFLTNTANSADFTGNFLSDGYWNYASQYYDEFYGPVYFFSYQHYENKRYGKDWWNYTDDYYYGNGDHYYREKRYPDETAPNGLSDIYRALCPSVDQSWNNNGSYIIVEVTFEDEYWRKHNNYYDPNTGSSDTWEDTDITEATVYYIIHEGCTYRVDGQDMEAMITSSRLDFQTQRNTQYLYDIEIGGANGLKRNVQWKDMDESNFHDDGIYGGATFVKKMELDNTNKATFRPMDEITVRFRKDLKWIYYMYSPGEDGRGSYSRYFGNWTNDDGMFVYDESEGYINPNYIWNPTQPRDPSDPPIYWPYEDYQAWEMLVSSIWVTKTNNLQTIENSFKELNEWVNEWLKGWSEKWEELHPDGDPQDDPSQYPDFEEFMEEFMKDYMENFPGEKMKYMPLYYFIQTSDDDPLLRLAPGEQFYYCIAPYLVTSTSGDNMNYERLDEYKRQFIIMEPIQGHFDNSSNGEYCMIANTHQFVQYAYDDRQQLNRMSFYSHDYSIGGVHNGSNFDYSTIVCGAPGTVTWIMVDQYWNSSDPYKNKPNYEVRIGNTTYYVESKDVIEIYRWSDRDCLLGLPIYIDSNNELSGNGYGYYDLRVTAKPDPRYYRTGSNDQISQEGGVFIQRRLNRNSWNTSGTWQWLFADVTDSTYGWSRIWEFYKDDSHMWNTDFEFGGLKIVNRKGTDVNQRKAISTAKYPLLDRKNDDDVTQVDCLTFGGGYGTKAPKNRDNDAMMLTFWIDRPGDIYLSFGYNGFAENREWRAYWRDIKGNTTSTTYLHWPNKQEENNHVIPEQKGIISSGDINNFWPDINPENGKFLDGPIEICIYMASSGGYIRSIEFDPWVWDITPKLPHEWVMPVPSIP